MATNVISGIGGHAAKTSTAIHRIRTWAIETKADVQAAIDSASSGAPVRLAGNDDWSGKYTAYGAVPLCKPGESFTFNGAIVTTGGGSPVSVGASGAAICKDVEIVIDIESGKEIGHTVSFEGTGALSFSAPTVAADTTVATPLTSIGCKATTTPVSGTQTETEIEHIKTITIKMSSDNKSYVDSSCAGHTGRVKGNFDAEVSIALHVDDFGDLPALNAVNELRVYVDSTHYWVFRWMIVTGVSGMDVDREGGALLAPTVTWALSGVQTVVVAEPASSTPTVGYVKTPDASPVTWWPA